MNLFDLEKRIIVEDEITRIDSLLKDARICYEYKGDFDCSNIYSLLNKTFLTWNQRGTALDMIDYFNSIDSLSEEYDFLNNIVASQYDSDTHLHYYLFFIQFIYNYNYHLLTFKKIKLNDDAAEVLGALNDNIRIVVDSVNYSFYEKNNQFHLTKRDVQLDAAINSINNSDISLELLSYLDVSNRKNIKEKTRIIAELYKYFESLEIKNKSEVYFKENKTTKNIDLLHDFNFICNKFNMRHWPTTIHKQIGKIDISDEEMLELLDICYYLALQLINSKKIVENNQKTQIYKSKYGFIK